MKTIYIFLLIIISLVTYAQETKIPRFQRISILDCGCSSYVPKELSEFEKTYSPDSSVVYTGTYTTSDNYQFGVIAVRLSHAAADLQMNPSEKENLLTAYMDFLQTNFEITAHAGYGKGHRMEKYPDAVGVIDYWQDATGKQYAVKGWFNGHTLSVLFIAGKDDYPYYNLQQMFLDGFRFE